VLDSLCYGLAKLMTEHPRLPTLVGTTPLSDWLRLGSTKRSLPNCEPMVVKCICPGRDVPFYCPSHGRVENPNWPVLRAKPRKSPTA
jgi:hypothetical protein